MKSKTNLVILILWFIIAIISLFHHEIWRDEAQVWCLVRDLNLFEIFQSTRVEGHPMLWYLLLYPLAKLGLPVEAMQVLSLLLVGSSVFFVLFKSPFSTFEKFVTVFSAGMIYYLPIVARNYCLIPLFIFLLASVYQKRKEHPYIYSILLILLSQTHILMLGFCVSLFLIFASEKLKEKKNYLPVCLIGSNFVFLFLSFYNASDNVVVQYYADKVWTLPELLYNFCYIYFNPLFKYSMELNCVIFYFSLMLVLYSLFKVDKKLCSVYVLSFSYIFYIFANIWFGGVSYQKAYLLLLIILFFYWVLYEKSKQLKIAVNILFIVSVFMSISAVVSDIKYNFSGSKQVANYIKESINEEAVFGILGSPYNFSPISAYLPEKKFYHIEYNDYLTYSTFDKVDDEQDDVKPTLKYFIVQQEKFLFEEEGYKKIFETDEINLSTKRTPEIFKIYIKE